jgi:murein DD-endopeptidase MepM/ murein hydrolase activator NlpD
VNAQALTEGKTFEEIFAQYEEFGITYREGSVYYNGELVNCFADVSNTGTFSYESKAKGGAVNLRTVYDKAGKLTGVETFTGSIQLTEGGLSWPLSEYREISGLFQGRIHPITGQKDEHTGLDITAPKDTPVLAAAAGAVTASGYDSKYGNYVLLSHGDGLETYYAHLTESSVNPGDTVTQGQTIGTVGSSGQSTGPHLHFEVRQNAVSQDPLNYFG